VRGGAPLGTESRRSGCWAERDLVAERLELTNETADLAVGVEPLFVEIGAEVDVAGGRIREQVPDDDEDRAGDRKAPG